MKYAEKDADKFWCPFARCEHSIIREVNGDIVSVKSYAVNRDENGLTVGNCVGSRCAAWRWDEKPDPGYEATNETYRPETGYRKCKGHCGLAGRP